MKELIEIFIAVFFSFLLGVMCAMAIYDSVSTWLKSIFKKGDKDV